MREWIDSDDAVILIASLKKGETRIVNFVEGYWILKHEIDFINGESQSILSKKYVERENPNDIPHNTNKS